MEMGFGRLRIPPKTVTRPRGLYLERVRGIEPPLRAWEARVLPLNYTRGSGPDDTGQAGTAASATAPGPALAAQSLATSPTGQDTPVPPMPQ